MCVIVVIQLVDGVHECVSCKVYLIVFCVLHSKCVVHSVESGMNEGDGIVKNIDSSFRLTESEKRGVSVYYGDTYIFGWYPRRWCVCRYLAGYHRQ